MALLADKIKGQASAQADTFTGKLKSLKTTVEDNVAEFGQKYGPALTAAGMGMTALGATMSTGKAIMDTLKNSTVLQTTATKLAEAAQWAWNAAMDANPIMLVVLAVAALIAAVILAYQHVGWFRAAVDAFANAAVGAFEWLLSVVQSVFGWIADHWQLLLAILLGPIGLAVDLIVNNFDRIKGAVLGAIGFAQSVLDGFVGFVSGLPGRVGGFFSGMFDGLKDAAKAAFNFVADAWNNTAGRLNFSIPDWVPGVGGKSFGVPSIPHWYATGGIFTSPSIIGVGEAGPEAVVPLDRMRQGPAVNIEHASFSHEVDIDLFMRRVAWHAQVGRV
jgi:phage-related protein